MKKKLFHWFERFEPQSHPIRSNDDDSAIHLDKDCDGDDY
jgi:hypothetical protein